MIVGFTGTRDGMSDAQSESLRFLLSTMKEIEFHHGDCVDADIEAAAIAREFGATIHGWPAWVSDRLRGKFANDVTHEFHGTHQRNMIIVETCQVLIATPLKGETASYRSGTWQTIREARFKQKKPHIVLARRGGCTYHLFDETLTDEAKHAARTQEADASPLQEDGSEVRGHR